MVPFTAFVGLYLYFPYFEISEFSMKKLWKLSFWSSGFTGLFFIVSFMSNNKNFFSYQWSLPLLFPRTRHKFFPIWLGGTEIFEVIQPEKHSLSSHFVMVNSVCGITLVTQLLWLFLGCPWWSDLFWTLRIYVRWNRFNLWSSIHHVFHRLYLAFHCPCYGVQSQLAPRKMKTFASAKTSTCLRHKSVAPQSISSFFHLMPRRCENIKSICRFADLHLRVTGFLLDRSFAIREMIHPIVFVV